ncbi:hypothetical protein [Celeribacter ethanolicus]|uniref:hypothetical protein n=1 Tax=Celeribacter ethanolicus TaxID=1758178 RepID=UPI000836D13A|nr:hypothetical protein [Celeribacter ethanolicus]
MLVCEPIEMSLDNISVSLPEDDAPAWDGVTAWGLGAWVVRGHRIFESMIADNTGIDPAAVDQSKVSAEWLEVQYTNAFRAFDGVLDNPTVGAENIVIDITVADSFDVLGLFGVRAVSVSVAFYNAAGQQVGERSLSLGGRIVSSWLEWFTVRPDPRRDKAFFYNIPVSARRAVIRIDGGDLRLGEVFLGRSFYVGEAQPKTAGRAVTASRYEVNDFGRTIWTKRPTRREMTYIVEAERLAFEAIEPRMGELAGSLVVTVGAFEIPSTIQFGILGTIDWAEDGPDEYLYSFTIKGLS